MSITIRPLQGSESYVVYQMPQFLSYKENETINKVNGISFNEFPVGFGKFRPFLNEICINCRAFHFSYMIAPKYCGKGYATQFVSFLILKQPKLQSR